MRLCPVVAEMRFMDVATFGWQGHALWVSRSGYTGEDGYENFGARNAGRGLCAARLLDQPNVAPIGLGARDSLRLEAGLCLYGHDMTEIDISGHGRAVMGHPENPPRRWRACRWLSGGRAYLAGIGPNSHWPSALACAPKAVRPCAKAPCCGTRLKAGVILAVSPLGGFRPPAFGAPIAMGYIPTTSAQPRHPALWGEVRGKRLPVTVL